MASGHNIIRRTLQPDKINTASHSAYNHLITNDLMVDARAVRPYMWVFFYRVKNSGPTSTADPETTSIT